MKVIITHASDQPIETKGNLIVLNDSSANIFSCNTLELPYKNNVPGISCIPCGIYVCEKVGITHIPYPHISVTNVPNRSGICIHYGNIATLTEEEIKAFKKPDILGCILTGDKYADINGDGIDDIVDSKTVFEKLMSVLPQKFILEIK